MSLTIPQTSLQQVPMYGEVTGNVSNRFRALRHCMVSWWATKQRVDRLTEAPWVDFPMQHLTSMPEFFDRGSVACIRPIVALAQPGICIGRG